MKKMVSMIISLIIVSNCLMAQKKNNSEEEAIKKAIMTGYVEGIHNEGNLEKIDLYFHPAFDLLGMKDNLITHLPVYTWKEYVKRGIESGKLPKKEEEKLTCRFPLIDVTGTAAIACIELYSGDKKIFTDYLSLYKFEEGWKIVGKIYYRHPSEKE